MRLRLNWKHDQTKLCLLGSADLSVRAEGNLVRAVLFTGGVNELLPRGASRSPLPCTASPCRGNCTFLALVPIAVLPPRWLRVLWSSANGHILTKRLSAVRTLKHLQRQNGIADAPSASELSGPSPAAAASPLQRLLEQDKMSVASVRQCSKWRHRPVVVFLSSAKSCKKKKEWKNPWVQIWFVWL